MIALGRLQTCRTGFNNHIGFPFQTLGSSPKSCPRITKGVKMVGGLVAVLIVIALVLVLLKVAVAGGILGLIAIILLVLLLLGRI